jgi:hypothetical protein
MRHPRILILINIAILLILFCYPLTWMPTKDGRNYLSMLSDYGENLLYLRIAICTLYSIFICFMLLNFKKLGVKLIVTWDIFIGMYLLIFWIGSYAMLKFYYDTEAVFDLSVSGLLKGLTGISLIILGLIFKSKKVSMNFR